MSSCFFRYISATAESWELSNWTHKLKTISDHLRQTLSNLYRLIGLTSEKIYPSFALFHPNLLVLILYDSNNFDLPYNIAV